MEYFSVHGKIFFLQISGRSGLQPPEVSFDFAIKTGELICLNSPRMYPSSVTAQCSSKIILRIEAAKLPTKELLLTLSVPPSSFIQLDWAVWRYLA